MELLKLDYDALSFDEFEQKTLEEKLLILPLLSPKKRFDFLTDLRDAGKLVQSMPVVDLAVTIKEIGIDGSGALLSLCSYEQIQYIMDLDTWEGFYFSKERMHNYMMVLREWSRETLLDKFIHMDYEQQLIYMLGDFKVFLAKEDFNPEEGCPDGTFTIDGVYYLKPNCDEEKQMLIKELLTEIFSEDHTLYLRLVEGMRQELYTNLEEDLYKIKSSRITELGFYEYEDAIGVYNEPTEIKREIIPPAIDNFTYSRLPVKYISEIEVVKDNIEEISQRTMMEILFELQVLINRLVVADRLEMFEIESVEESSNKVKALLRLGLEVIKAEHNIKPADAIKNYYVIDIFRHGYKKLKLLREEARRIISIHQYLKFVGLPLYFENLLRIAKTNFGEIDMMQIFSDAKYTYPCSIQEIQRLFDLLYEIEASLEIIIRCYDIKLSDFNRIKETKINIPYQERPGLFCLLITPFANYLLTGKSILSPVSSNNLEKLCNISFVKNGDDVTLSDRFLREMEDKIFSPLKEISLYPYARRIMGRALEEYIGELGGISDFKDIKIEYISCIILEQK